jgi:hypothetical protein
MAMKILGLPVMSFLILIVIPSAIILVQFYYCWRIYKQNRETRRRKG